ncbi:DUF262 domain-containing protein [Chryseobacterium sp.]|uniref:DUF262 domain-containing protein n=1 Tax=Chryseobacterium sp. TaxID=1871047 RepID=UPI00289A8AD0|nr:DUF262 domain-containing protein [Chryseobacterium sp.]
MAHIANKIDAKDVKLQNVFYGNRYKIDVFQREYRWQREQIEALISDLCSSFLNNYSINDTIESAITYDCYYMGPIVLCEDENTLSIVDGQQRLTSFTLLLIFLNHLQNFLLIEDNQKQDLENYIFVKKAGKKTLVLNVEARNEVTNQLYLNGNNIFLNSEETHYEFDYSYSIIEESIENIKNRYDDIVKFFPPELKEKEILPIFIEWLLNRVVLVEIKAYSLENAYTIFETMNDRGLSLNPTEILKAYLLSNIKDEEKAVEANERWKELINDLKVKIGQQDADLDFFKNWLRAKYAVTRRGTFKGSENEDFEKIGVQFHAWVKNNHKSLSLKKDLDYYYFILTDLEFYVKEYLKLYFLKNGIDTNLDDFYITNSFAIADSLVYPLFLAPIKKIDGEDCIDEKYFLINRFVDVYTNIRMLYNKPITQSSIRNYFYDLIRDTRNKDVADLKNIFSKEEDKLKELKSNNYTFYVDNWGYYHYLFARILYSKDEIKSEYAFNELLRNRKQNSYVLVQIFRNDELEKFEDLGVLNMENTIGNYCLIRRYDLEEFSNKQTRYKLSFLNKKNYLPEMPEDLIIKEMELFDFIDYRNRILSSIISEIWI